jgi:molecular chaperone GrpE
LSDHEPELKVVDKRWWVNAADRDGTAAADAGTATGTGEAWEPGKPTYVEELEGQIAARDQQIADLLAKYREASSEFDAARARLRKDVARDVERGRRTMLVEMLEVLDNLDRAIEAGRGAAGDGSLLQGVEMVRRLFLAKLDGFGVTRLEPLGERFDPALHEAVTVVPVPESSQDQVICGVLQCGYLIAGDVLRPARVAVGQYPGADR